MSETAERTRYCAWCGAWVAAGHQHAHQAQAEVEALQARIERLRAEVVTLGARNHNLIERVARLEEALAGRR